MKKPLIGIPTNLYFNTSPEFIGTPYDHCNNLYSQCIVKAGGIPIYLPVCTDFSVIESQLSRLDGLLLPGGGDVNPLLYGDEPRPLQETSNECVDAFQLYLTQLALDKQLPILAICRGEQLLNVAAGGTLYQDITYANKTPLQHRQKSHLTNLSHDIIIERNSLLAQPFGFNVTVNSCHHQAIKDLGHHLKISAVSSDGIIEAIEMTNAPFVVGVQWHPEMLALEDEKMLQLFKMFVREAALT